MGRETIMESRMMELMEAIQESEGQAERRVLTLLGGYKRSEHLLVWAADTFLKRHWS